VKWVLIGSAGVVAALVVVLVIMMRGDAEPVTPFDGEGNSAGICWRLCEAEIKCKTATWTNVECTTACLQLAVIRETKPACEEPFTDALGCWWRATQVCAPETTCAAAWAEAFSCVCKLPDLPPEMAPRCKGTE
jgi:hypothetical protein